ncbi:uncharacterized protein [Montipora foliosa]|uniref:uncharacterized protein n=1 Tax=Montipora foliosa TaxID=591990 RepID=UPI0035F14A23
MSVLANSPLTTIYYKVLQRASVPPSNLPQDELRALHDLRKGKDRLIIQADKGNCTVVMDQKDYDEKVQQILNDQKTYKVLDKDSTQRTERKLNEKLANLKREDKINDNLYKKLRSCDGLPPRFYDLQKVHKPGHPLRPIVSFIDSPTYMLSKHLAQTLKLLVGKTDFPVKNSLDFCDQIKHIKVEEDDELVSFDIVSLFTSIPVELAIQVATDVLCKDDTLYDRNAIPVEDIIDLLEFCLPTTNFKYNTHYQQIFGTAMALLCQPLWPIWSWKTYSNGLCPPLSSSLGFGNDMSMTYVPQLSLALYKPCKIT